MAVVLAVPPVVDVIPGIFLVPEYIMQGVLPEFVAVLGSAPRLIGYSLDLKKLNSF